MILTDFFGLFKKDFVNLELVIWNNSPLKSKMHWNDISANAFSALWKEELAEFFKVRQFNCSEGCQKLSMKEIAFFKYQKIGLEENFWNTNLPQHDKTFFFSIIVPKKVSSLRKRLFVKNGHKVKKGEFWFEIIKVFRIKETSKFAKQKRIDNSLSSYSTWSTTWKPGSGSDRWWSQGCYCTKRDSRQDSQSPDKCSVGSKRNPSWEGKERDQRNTGRQYSNFQGNANFKKSTHN